MCVCLCWMCLRMCVRGRWAVGKRSYRRGTGRGWVSGIEVWQGSECMGIGRRGLAALWLCVLLVIASVNGEPAIAQSYSFRVPELKLQVTVQPDGSARLAYDITFENEGTPIDIIDIGLPWRLQHRHDVGVDQWRCIDRHTDVGVHRHRRGNPPGRSRYPDRRHRCPAFRSYDARMVYQDTTNKELASLRITPTWFEGDRSRDRVTSASRCIC